MQWHFIENGASVGPVTFDHLKAYFASGRVTAGSLVWRNDFGSEWRALGQLPEFSEFRAPAGPPPVPAGHATPPPVPGASMDAPSLHEPGKAAPVPPTYTYSPRPAAVTKAYPVYRNHGLGTALAWLFRIELVYWIVMALVPIVSRENGRIAVRTLEEQYRFTLLMEGQGWMIFGGIVTAIPAILFLIWKYRLTANLFSLRGPQSVTPAGAVYWYFVPVAFLWKPYEAMRNLFVSLTAPSVHGLAIVWWILALVSTLVAPLTFVLFTPDTVRTVSDARLYVYGTLAINVLAAISVYLGAEVVKLLTAADKKAVETSGRIA